MPLGKKQTFIRRMCKLVAAAPKMYPGSGRSPCLFLVIGKLVEYGGKIEKQEYTRKHHG